MAAGVTLQLKRHKTGELDMTTKLADGEFLLDTVNSRLYIGDGSSTLEELVLNGMTLYLDKKAQEPQPIPTGTRRENYRIAGTYLDDSETYQVSGVPGGFTTVEKPCTLSGSLGSKTTPVYISNGQFALCNRYPVVSVQDNNSVPRLICGVADGDTELGTISTSTNLYTLPNSPSAQIVVGPCYIKNGVVWTAPSLTSQETIPAKHQFTPYNIAPALTAYTKGLSYDSSMTLDEILTDISVRLEELGG